MLVTLLPSPVPHGSALDVVCFGLRYLLVVVFGVAFLVADAAFVVSFVPKFDWDSIYVDFFLHTDGSAACGEL